MFPALIGKSNDRSKTLSRFGCAFAASISLSLFMGMGASARDIAPELVSRVWLDNGQQAASVVLNGDEVVRFKADDNDDDEAAEEAEELAVKLQELISDKRFDASLLVAVKDEDKSVIKYDGEEVISFDYFAGQADDDTDEKKRCNQAYEASAKLVNALRVAFGAPAFSLNTPNDIADKPMSKLEMLGRSFSGAASWYGGRFNGRRCSNGTRFNEERLTAAHRSLPFGTKLLVKNRRSGDTCVVEVTDRGPFIDGRIIDLSKGAARQLNMVSSGVAYVECTVVQ